MTIYDEGIQAKLDSARRKLEGLRADIRTFAETQRGKISINLSVNEETGKKSCSPRLMDDFDTPPIEWSISIGEIVYHLRSSLDHLVYNLVCENGGNPTRTNSFPVIWEIDNIIHEVIYSEKGSEYVKKRREYIDKRVLKGVSEQKKARILLSQGFNVHAGDHGAYDISTDPSEFSHLAYLCNLDKHRHLISVKPKLGGLTDDYRIREDETMREGEPPPELRNTDIEIGVCLHIDQDDDRPSDLSGTIDDVLTDIVLAVEHTIDYVSGRSPQPFAYLTNGEKYQLRRRSRQRPL